MTGKVVVVLPQPTEDGAVELSFRNLTRVRVAYAGASAPTTAPGRHVLFTAAALDALEARPAAEARRWRSEVAP